MGEIAEDMIDGTSCSMCGVYFNDTHGYPVACSSCWKEMTKEQQRNSGIQKSTIKEC